MSINTRLAISIGLAFFIVGLVVIFWVNLQMKARALNEAEEKARIILDSNLAIHTYFTHQLKPLLFDTPGLTEDKESFDPVWMSSTYAVRKINSYFEDLHNRQYYYKEAALNARHPDNEADAYERAFLEKINRDEDLTSRSEIRLINDKPFFTVLRRGESMKEDCLRCHSRPENAPLEMVQDYGPERSFNRFPGEVVSAISIRIPLSAAYESANRLSVHLALVFGLCLFGLYGLIILMNKFWIFEPLRSMREKARMISAEHEHLGEQIAPPPGRELKELVADFNKMSLQLRHEREELENRVLSRTRELQKINEDLEKEIIERRQAQKDLAQKSEELESALAEKDKFFSIMAHDLKSPISGLMTLTEMMDEDVDGYSLQELRKTTSALRRSTKSVFALVENLLEWSRMQRGMIDYNPQKISLFQSVYESFEMLEASAAKKNIAVSLHVDRDIYLSADVNMLSTILRNLMSNAIKFTDHGGEITVAAVIEGSMVKLAVQDTGVGMSQDMSSKLFRLDQKASCYGTRGEKGTGLGLLLCKEFVEKHGGRIWVESLAGQGATIYFTLPRNL